MIIDNNRYFNVVYNSQNTTQFIINLANEEVKQIMNHPGYNNAQKYVLRLYLGLNKDNLKDIQSEGKAHKQLLRKIRGSYEYMDTLKKDVYAMQNFCGNPTLFLTLTSAEYVWYE